MRWAGQRAVLLAALLAGSMAHAQAPVPPWGLGALMHTLSQVHSATADFTERKTSPLLSAPLIAQGTLTYVAPDYMRKVTRAPVPERFILDHGQVTMSGGPAGPAQTFPLAAAPQIGGLVEAIRATLAGDLPALDRFYDVQLSGGEDGWQLRLRPKNQALARFVRMIVIEGSASRITRIDTLSRDGSDSDMSISESDGP